MLYRRLAAAALVLLLAVPAFANSKAYNATVNATDSNTSLTVTDNRSGGSGQPFEAKQILVRSDAASANTCFVDWLDDTATTADTPISPGESLMIPVLATYIDAYGFGEVGVICDTGETATIRITGIR